MELDSERIRPAEFKEGLWKMTGGLVAFTHFLDEELVHIVTPMPKPPTKKMVSTLLVNLEQPANALLSARPMSFIAAIDWLVRRTAS